MPATQARKELVALKVRLVSSVDATVATTHARARDFELTSPLDEEADAQALSDAILAFFGATRHKYVVQVAGMQFQRLLGETVNLVYSRFGLSGGKDGVVLAVAENTDAKSTNLTIFI